MRTVLIYKVKAQNKIQWRQVYLEPFHVDHQIIIQGGPPQNPEFIKNCEFILTCLNFSNLQSTLHLMQYTYWDFFPTA